ncbi:MAG: hypothetical protein LBF22_00895 [Deltaproteobacteria bacterium]|jgi:exodeoxyribonuclease V alpha subunit|nr:hypothetical protein [Deltaproteobacteria bacterium]
MIELRCEILKVLALDGDTGLAKILLESEILNPKPRSFGLFNHLSKKNLLERLARPRGPDSKIWRASGLLGFPIPGEVVQFQGDFELIPPDNFSIKDARLSPPETEWGYLNFLTSGIFPNLNPEEALSLINYFGPELFSILEKSPVELSKVKDFPRQKREKLIEAYQRYLRIKKFENILMPSGLGPIWGDLFEKNWGLDFQDLLGQNPWEIFKLKLLSIQQIQRILSALSPSPPPPTEIVPIHFMWENYLRGRLTVDYQELLANTSKYFSQKNTPLNTKDLKKSLDRLLSVGALTSQLGKFPEERPLFLSQALKLKNTLITQLKLQKNSPTNLFSAAITQIPPGIDPYLELHAQELIKLFSRKNMVCLFGPTGSGKTELAGIIVDILEKIGAKTDVLAISYKDFCQAQTKIHQTPKTIFELLEYSPLTSAYSRGKFRQLTLDFLVILGAELLEPDLLSKILEATPPQTKVLLVGDYYPLKKDHYLFNLTTAVPYHLEWFVNSSNLHHLALRNILQGEFTPSPNRDPQASYYFIRAETNQEILRKCLTLFSERIPKRLNLPVEVATAIATPFQTGTLGTKSLNHEIKRLNEPLPLASKQLPTENVTLNLLEKNFFPKDRVITLFDDPSRSLIRGKIGYVSAAEENVLKLKVEIEGKQHSFKLSEIMTLTPAWALTTAEILPTSFPAIVLPLGKGASFSLNRYKLYQILSRSTALAIIVGNPGTLMGVLKNP